MEDHDFCRVLLRGSRDGAAESKTTIPKLTQASTKIGHSRWFYIQGPGGELIWEGEACCAFEAKSKAVRCLSDMTE